MTPLDAVAVLLAGMAAGAINTVVGSGSLITFPTLVAIGFAPLVANVSNTIGLVPGSMSGAYGYRRELVGQRPRIIRLGIAAGLGGLTGAILLLALPSSAFNRIVPILVLLAVVLVIIQPRVARWLRSRRKEGNGEASVALPALVYLTAIYGGYFGAAQSVILFAILAILINDDLQRLNGLKNVLTLTVNGVAAILFVASGEADWSAVVLIAIGSIIGAQIGATVGRRLPPQVLRAVIVVVGLAVAVKLLAS
jgi:uncharacterized membrane protein YfcA